MITCDPECPWHDHCIICSRTWRHRRWFRKFNVRFRPIRKEIVSSTYTNSRYYLTQTAESRVSGVRNEETRKNLMSYTSNEVFFFYFVFLSFLFRGVPGTSLQISVLTTLIKRLRSRFRFNLLRGKYSKHKTDQLSRTVNPRNSIYSQATKRPTVVLTTGFSFLLTHELCASRVYLNALIIRLPR